MFPPQIGFLYLSLSGPCSTFCRGPINDSIIRQRFVVSRSEYTASSNDTKGPNSDSVMYTRTSRESVEEAYRWSFDSAVNFKEIVVADTHDFFTSTRMSEVVERLVTEC